MIINTYKKQENGYAALLLTIMVSVISVSIVALIATQLSRSSKALFAGRTNDQAKVIADSCAEEVLFGIKNTTIGAGSAALSLHGGDCDYTVTSLGGDVYDIAITAMLQDSYYKTRISIDEITPDIHITQWKTNE